jgi:hypothetical protein
MRAQPLNIGGDLLNKGGGISQNHAGNYHHLIDKNLLDVDSEHSHFKRHSSPFYWILAEVMTGFHPVRGSTLWYSVKTYFFSG